MILAKIFCAIDKITEWFIIFGMAALVVVCFMAVIFRSFIGSSLFWTDEFMRYLFVNVTFYGSPLLVYRKSHIIVNITDMIFPLRVRRILEIAVNVGLVVLGVSMMFITIPLVQMGMAQMSSAMRIRMGIVYLCMPVGFGMTAINGLRLLWDLLVEKKSTKGGEGFA